MARLILAFQFELLGDRELSRDRELFRDSELSRGSESTDDSESTDNSVWRDLLRSLVVHHYVCSEALWQKSKLTSAIGQGFLEGLDRRFSDGDPAYLLECWTENDPTTYPGHESAPNLASSFFYYAKRATLWTPRTTPIPKSRILFKEGVWLVSAYGGKTADISDRMRYLKRVWDDKLEPNDKLEQCKETIQDALGQLTLGADSLQTIHEVRQQIKNAVELLGSFQKLGDVFLDSLGERVEKLGLAPAETRNLLGEIDLLETTFEELGKAKKARKLVRALALPRENFFNELRSEIGKAPHEFLVKTLTDYIARYEGKSFGSLEANQEFAFEIGQAMKSLGLKAVCPGSPKRGRRARGTPESVEACGQAASYLCGLLNNYSDGVFYFSHRINGKAINHAVSQSVHALTFVPDPGQPFSK